MRVAGLASIGIHASLLAGLAWSPLLPAPPGQFAVLDVTLLAGRSVPATRSGLATAPAPAPSARPRSELRAAVPEPRPAKRRRAPKAKPKVQARPRPAPVPEVAARAQRVAETEPAGSAARAPQPSGTPSLAALPQLSAVSAPPGDGPTSTKARGRGSAQDAQPLYQPEPDYPRLALSSGREGWVEVSFTIRRDGRTSDVRIVRASPAEIFDRAAIEAVSQWRYAPPKVGGAATERRDMRVVIEFEIKLRRAPIQRH